jgi:nucleotide-binding universal stress UspA family protein
MTYPTILLPLDDDTRATARLDQAIAFARAHSSHLIGLSCHRPAPNLTYEATVLQGIDPLTLDLQRSEQLARHREVVFRRHCDSGHLASFECFVDGEESSRAIERRSRMADLVVIGQPDPVEPGHGARRDVLDHVLIHGTAPTLVLPYAGEFPTPGERVLIAWDGSHGCARAAAAALPLLGQAREVHLVSFDRTVGESGRIPQEVLEPVTQWLARHGVTARARVLYSSVDPGNAMLSHAADVDADLLVMGAWGQSRLVERMLGGATRTVLDSMTLPVLMAH